MQLLVMITSCELGQGLFCFVYILHCAVLMKGGYLCWGNISMHTEFVAIYALGVFYCVSNYCTIVTKERYLNFFSQNISLKHLHQLETDLSLRRRHNLSCFDMFFTNFFAGHRRPLFK